MKRPSVTTRANADQHHLPGQRIIEFSFPGGAGGLMSFATDAKGRPTIAVYRHDPAVIVAVCPSGYHRPRTRTRTPSRSVEIVMERQPEPKR
jgi:hypothetical protein